MRAVKRFKNAIASKRPHRMDGLFGQDIRIVQPPLSISEPSPHHHPHKTRSVDAHDRRLIEKDLVVKGVHHEIDTRAFDSSFTRQDKLTVTHLAPLPSEPTEIMSKDSDQSAGYAARTPKRELNANPQDHRPESSSTQPRNIEKPKDHGKGHAHDPLEDHLFLEIGPGGSDEVPDPPAVSESPPAAGINIYEAAYKEEIRRIREKRGKDAMLYLTRRVNKKEYMDDDNIVAGARDTASAVAKSGFAKFMDLAKRKGDRGKEERESTKEGATDEQEGQHEQIESTAL